MGEGGNNDWPLLSAQHPKPPLLHHYKRSPAFCQAFLSSPVSDHALSLPCRVCVCVCVCVSCLHEQKWSLQGKVLPRC